MLASVIENNQTELLETTDRVIKRNWFVSSASGSSTSSSSAGRAIEFAAAGGILYRGALAEVSNG
jgi:hypothetical protein